MIRIRVSAHLVSRVCRDGMYQPAFILHDGVPRDASLSAARYDEGNEQLVLEFKVPNDRGEVIEIAPTLRQVPAGDPPP